MRHLYMLPVVVLLSCVSCTTGSSENTDEKPITSIHDSRIYPNFQLLEEFTGTYELEDNEFAERIFVYQDETDRLYGEPEGKSPQPLTRLGELEFMAEIVGARLLFVSPDQVTIDRVQFIFQGDTLVGTKD
ncbi:hypothetical protein [Pontibacter sp. G13]|uniref:hypothetical protein n=1 Tax=Pontibacter sp. G13 TaxID=3074898 RepID=UPI00288B8FF3|nr:hypothetical protein [Pontibacter sp. G13]WNJ17316.1 hypothetical protein RJD25_20900 [Pontibacter sp. G13]